MNTILGEPALTTSGLSRVLGFTVNREFLESLGISPDEQTNTANLYLTSNLTAICYAISQHCYHVQKKALG